jgi:hypothetical protein
MAIGGRIMTAFKAGVSAFRESYFDANTLDLSADAEWSDFDARRLRYQIQWAFFQGNAYRDIHQWAKKMKADYGLYKYTRDIYNPAFRLGSFYRAYLWGGALDMKAGDGQERPSALPIVMESESQQLRAAIAQLWQWSNWKSKRKLVPLHGATLGDVFISVMDDQMRGKVYLEITHPGIVADVEKDPFGNIKSYIIQYQTDDPESPGKDATYREDVYRGENDNIVYELTKNGKPYHWDNTNEAGEYIDTWEAPYGFIPMVHIQHFDVGLQWGMSELFPKLAAFREVDDLGSKLNDQVRKLVDSPWLFAGMKDPSTTPQTTRTAPTTQRPEIGREEVPALYTNDPAAKAYPLVAPLDIAAVAAKIQDDLEQLEKDYPELALLRAMNATDNLSGTAIERLQSQSSEKVIDYRDSYDDALVRAQQMAVAIGGYRGYEGFEGFNLESYAAGLLNHEIGPRDVFTMMPMQKLERDIKRAEAQQKATLAGWDLVAYLQAQNTDQSVIDLLVSSPGYQAKLAMMQLGLQTANMGNEG